MQVIQADYITQVLKLQLPGDPKHWGSLIARVAVTQPCGYVLEVDAEVEVEGKRGQIAVRYPLMDDGLWDEIDGPSPIRKYDTGSVSPHMYDMGTYRFTVEVLNNGSPIVTETTVVDQDQFYADNVKGSLRHNFPPGFIECAPLRPVCIDHDEVPVTIRLKTERVPKSRVRVDVTARRGTEPLVEPVELDLTDEPQIVRFQHHGWERGEYWIRVQLVEDGKPWGPYMVRKFWKEVIGPDVQPESPLKLGSSLQYMVDGWLFEEVKDIDFWPMSYEPDPDKPAVVKDKPWEYRVLNMRSLVYDEAEGLYKMEYTSSPETYRSRGYGWHLLADGLSSSMVQPDDSGRWLEAPEHRPVNAREDRGPSVADGARASIRPAYESLLHKLLNEGTPVREYDFLPDGFSFAVLSDPRPDSVRISDYLLLAVPGIRADGALPSIEDFREEDVQLFEMYPEDLDRPGYVCLATSKNGVDWQKPQLDQVNFHGSTANNILGVSADSLQPAGKLSFRMYYPAKDGPVNVDNVQVSMIANGRNPKVSFMWPDDFEGSMEAIGFKPILRSYYPMMRAGDSEYLFLSDKPLIYTGPGADLMHSGESIRHQIERTDDQALFWYYRPDTPGYPPHNMPWDNHQGPIRNLAVMWTSDGMNFHKRFSVSPDEFDPPGMQFYNMGLIREIQPDTEGDSGRGKVVVRSGEMYVAELRCYPSGPQQQYPELIWTRDLLHWHRFTHNRAPLVKLGEKEGSYNWGMYFQEASYYPFKDKDGNQAWWLSNTARSARHNHVGVGHRFPTLEKMQARCAHYSEAPFFVDWQTLWRRGQEYSSYPMFTHIKPGRLAYAAATGSTGETISHPIVFDGEDLVLNAQVEAGGSLRVEVQDEDGRVVDGYSLADSDPFQGDEVDHRPSWKGRRLAQLSGRHLKFRIALEKAKLFSLHIEEK